jgi:hypothetical protein
LNRDRFRILAEEKIQEFVYFKSDRELKESTSRENRESIERNIIWRS